MEYRKLPGTGISVSLICLGTMTWGRQNTEADGHAQLDYALDQGVNFIDTAEMYAVPALPETYGRTETIIGNWLARRADRDKIILATKMAGAGRMDWIRSGKNRIDRANIPLAVEESLRRLQTDYIDLYQLHWPNRASPHFGAHWDFAPEADAAREADNFLEVLTCLDGLIRQGKIRHIGLSNETPWGTMKYLELSQAHGLPRMITIQNEYSLLNRMFEPDFTEISTYENIGLLAWSPLAQGMISGKYLGGKRPPGTRWTLIDNPYRDTEAAAGAVRAYMDVAARHNLSVTQMALAFVNARPFVTATIIGATTMDQLKSNIDSVNIRLDHDILSDINAVYRRYPLPY